MTLEERIEAAAREDSEYYDEYPPQTQKMARDIAEKILRAAYPELHSDKPSHWLAPWEMTHEMRAASVEASDSDDG